MSGILAKLFNASLGHTQVLALPQTAQVCSSAVGDVFQSAQVCVARYNRGADAVQRAVGHLAYGASEYTLFDLASLTKVLSTTTLLALLQQEGQLLLDDSIQKYWPDVASRSNVEAFLQTTTIRSLLLHTSGLPPVYAFHSESQHAKAGANLQILAEQLLTKISDATIALNNINKTVYSDLGFLLLGAIIEKIENASLDEIFRRRICAPLGLERLQYLPVDPNIAPTEVCAWRERLLIGEVHDEMAAYTHGVAAHAGVFGNAASVLSIAEAWLQPLLLQPSALHLRRETVELFFAKDISGRALGWDVPSPLGEYRSCGAHFSDQSRGHLGFTGTSLWMDPQNGVIAVVLTNRVYPTRANTKIREFRPLVHDAIMRDCGF